MSEFGQKPLSSFSPEDRALIKSALRRAFSRSTVHKQIEEQYRIDHFDERKPRCKKWSWCASCGEIIPTWTCDVDHKLPVVPLDKFLEEMTPMELFYGVFCDPSNLWSLCEGCHNRKSSLEKTLRKKRPPRPRKPRAPKPK